MKLFDNFIVLIIVPLITLILVGGFLLDSRACHRFEANTGYNVRYELTGGCFAETPQGWIPAELIRQLDQ